MNGLWLVVDVLRVIILLQHMCEWHLIANAMDSRDYDEHTCTYRQYVHVCGCGYGLKYPRGLFHIEPNRSELIKMQCGKNNLSQLVLTPFLNRRWTWAGPGIVVWASVWVSGSRVIAREGGGQTKPHNPEMWGWISVTSTACSYGWQMLVWFNKICDSGKSYTALCSPLQILFSVQWNISYIII